MSWGLVHIVVREGELQNLMGHPFFFIHSFYKFLDCKQMCTTVPFARYKCSYQRTWQHRDAAWVHCCCPSFHVWGDLYMHSVITEAQCVTNEKFNDDQGQGLRLWNLLFPLAAWGIFHYCTVRTLTESSIIPSSAAGLQSSDNATQAGAKKRHYRLMTGNTEPCPCHNFLFLQGYMCRCYFQGSFKWLLAFP